MAAQEIATSRQQIHRQSIDAPLSEVAGELQELLSRRLMAVIAGAKEGKTVSHWANGEVTEIRDPLTEQRLRTAYEIALMLLEHVSPQTVRAWFNGLNPQLDDVSPAEAIHYGHLKEALSAARTFVSIGNNPHSSSSTTRHETV